MVKRGKAPAFQFYVSNFMGSTKVQLMSNEEVGAYVRLLCFAWDENGLPNDHKTLAKFLRVTPGRFQKLWKIIGKCWYEDGEKYRQKKQELVRAAQDTHHKKSTRGGEKSAEMRALEREQSTPRNIRRLALLVALLAPVWLPPKGNPYSESYSESDTHTEYFLPSNQRPLFRLLEADAPTIARKDGRENSGREEA